MAAFKTPREHNYSIPASEKCSLQELKCLQGMVGPCQVFHAFFFHSVWSGNKPAFEVLKLIYDSNL